MYFPGLSLCVQRRQPPVSFSAFQRRMLLLSIAGRLRHILGSPDSPLFLFFFFHRTPSYLQVDSSQPPAEPQGMDSVRYPLLPTSSSSSLLPPVHTSTRCRLASLDVFRGLSIAVSEFITTLSHFFHYLIPSRTHHSVISSSILRDRALTT